MVHCVQEFLLNYIVGFDEIKCFLFRPDQQKKKKCFLFREYGSYIVVGYIHGFRGEIWVLVLYLWES